MKHRADTNDHYYSTARGNNSRLIVPRFIHIGKMDTRRAWTYPLHTHRCNEFFLVTKGAASVVIDGEDHTVKAGGMYFVMTGQTHAEKSVDTPLAFQYIKFESTGISGRTEPIVTGLSVRRQFMNSTPAPFVQLFRSIADEAEGDLPGAKDVIEAHIGALIWHIRRSVGAVDGMEHTMRQLRIVETAREYAAKNCMRTLRLDEIADACAVSPDYLGHLFKEHVGTSPLQYAMSVRIEEAKRLMSGSGMSASEAAQALGFSSVFHFSKKFKQIVHVSPGLWCGRIQKKQQR